MEVNRNIIFDTAGFLAGLENLLNKVYTTPYVINEVKDLASRNSLSLATSSGKVIVMEPSKNSINKVLKAIKEINEQTLSKTDISIIALSLDLSPSLVFTDDLSLQNVLLRFNIPFKSVKLNKMAINEKKFIYICQECKRKFNLYLRECPYCGGKIVKINK
ncbi:NOB1 family endonuclease [Acidianus sp.]|uniref:NOB1 family endonuclease n=1 Tax=Acidianus sp. TaxID=1872104 RepID=UPI003978E10B